MHEIAHSQLFAQKITRTVQYTGAGENVLQQLTGTQCRTVVLYRGVIGAILMDFTRVKVITTVPAKEADKLRAAMAKAGTGNMGDYRECSFSIVGKGRFRPTKDADPHIGKANKLEVVEEEQVNVMCKREDAKNVVAALRKTHPYEEPLIEIIPLLDEADL